MLQTIRDRFSGPIALLVVAVIGITLAISFGNMSTDIASPNVAAIIDGEELPMARFQQVYQAQLARQQQAFQGELPDTLRQQLRVNAIETLVRNRVITHYAEDRGYRISDEEVMAAIRSEPVFQIDNQFSPESFIAILSSQNISPEAYEEEQRSQLQLNQVQQGVINSSFFTPSEYRRFIALDREQRDATVARFDHLAMLDSVEVSDEEILAVYNEGQSRFQTDESVAIEYIELRLADIAQTVDVDDAEVREYYEANLDRFRSAEERRARHILIAVNDDRSEAEAQALAAQLQSSLDEGVDFALLAAQYSDDPGSAADGGDLGWAGTGVYVPEFEAALFALKPGEVSAPVRTQFGIHLIQLQEVREGEQKPFDEVRDQLRAELQTAEAEDAFYELAERLDDLALENPGSLEPAAQATGLPIQRAERITRSGGEPFGFEQDIVDAAFSLGVLEDGENSPLIDLGDSKVLVLRVTEHRLPQLRPFDEVQAEIEQELRLQAASEKARELGEALLARAQAGEALEDAAADMGAELLSPGPLSRRDDVLAPDLLAEIFGLPLAADPQANLHGFAAGDGSYAVLRLNAVIPGRPEDIARAERDQGKLFLAQRVGSAELQAVLMDLRASADVEISPDVLAPDEEF